MKLSLEVTAIFATLHILFGNGGAHLLCQQIKKQAKIPCQKDSDEVSPESFGVGHFQGLRRPPYERPSHQGFGKVGQSTRAFFGN